MPRIACRKPQKSFVFKFSARYNFFIQVQVQEKYMKLTTDILPKAMWNSCEEILRIERVTSILLKTLKFLMAFAM
jgi:hypothetical protein